MFDAPVNSLNNSPQGLPDAASSSGPFTYANEDIGKGDGVYISTYGCQMNNNDTERMYALLEMVNFVPVATPEQAKLIIINSCSVREKPVHKVFSEVGRYRRLKSRDERIRIGVAGCVAQQEKQKLVEAQPLIDFVLGPDNIDQIPEIVARVRTGGRAVQARFEHQKPYFVETLIRNPSVTAFVNITKGCDNFCSFCVVPFTRGRERSRALASLTQDVETLIQRGVKEVTLLGQNVNSYESDCGADFADLLETLARDTGLQRIRYTTSHPKDFNQKLVDISAKYRSKICDYIHLPAQSGNTEVLARMNRGYSREQYLEKVDMIRKAIPGVALSTDIIVGFPGETEEQFQDTLSLIQEVGYDNVYAFKYSPRPFTKAARFEDQVPEPVKEERLARLIELQNRLAFALVAPMVGTELEVLIEKYDEGNGSLSGRCPQNKLVYFSGSSDLVGSTVRVRINKAAPATLRGELVP